MMMLTLYGTFMMANASTVDVGLGHELVSVSIEAPLHRNTIAKLDVAILLQLL